MAGFLHGCTLVDTFIQQLINGLVLGSMYALVALGYTMVYGIINLINFAHGEVLMVGALVSWTVVTHLADSGLPGWALLALSLVVAMLACMALNYLIEKLAYRPLRNAPRLAPLITAMGMSLLLQTLAMIIWKPDYKPYPILLPDEPYEVLGASINMVQILILGVTAVTLAGLMFLINGTKLGRAMRATAENPRVAQLMGVQPDKVISATFIIGAALAALAWWANLRPAGALIVGIALAMTSTAFALPALAPFLSRLIPEVPLWAARPPRFLAPARRAPCVADHAADPRQQHEQQHAQRHQNDAQKTRDELTGEVIGGASGARCTPFVRIVWPTWPCSCTSTSR